MSGFRAWVGCEDRVEAEMIESVLESGGFVLERAPVPAADVDLAVGESLDSLASVKGRRVLMGYRELDEEELRVLYEKDIRWMKKPFLPHEFLAAIEGLFA